MARVNLSPLIIAVAITGGLLGKELKPNHPEKPKEQAQQTYDCYNAGASMVHINARDQKNLSVPTCDAAVYWRINALIREKCPEIIINNTTGGGIGSFEERLQPIDAGPEVASIDMGPLALKFVLKKRPDAGRPEELAFEGVLPATFGSTEKYAKAMLDKGIKPGLEVWHTGQLWLVRNLIDKGLVEPPYLIQFVMGF